MERGNCGCEKASQPVHTRVTGLHWMGICPSPAGGGAIGAVSERLQSGRRGCESGWGRRFLAVGNAVGAGVGVWECLWGGVSAMGRGEWYPPPSLQAIPWAWSPAWGRPSGPHTRTRHVLCGRIRGLALGPTSSPLTGRPRVVGLGPAWGPGPGLEGPPGQRAGGGLQMCML